jgi:hypothetical protein
MHYLKSYFFQLLMMATCIRWGQWIQVPVFISAVLFYMCFPLDSELYPPRS